MTLYQTLEVSNEASKETLNAAYRSLAKRFHPDVNSTPQAKERMAAITEAYAILSDDVKRAEYDAKLAEFSSSKGNQRQGRQQTHQGFHPQDFPQQGVPYNPGPGIFVEDLALGLLESHLLPLAPGFFVDAYPLARKDLRSLIAMGVERLVKLQ